MNARSRIVLHADDLGMNAAVNEGIMSGFVHGLLTSTSIMANAPEFVDGVTRWTSLNQEFMAGRLVSADRRRALGDHGDSAFDIGVHLNLTQGMPLTSGFPAECRDALGRFAGIGLMLRRLTLSSASLRSAVRQELEAQIARVVDAGLRPTHLNGHHYVELIPALAEPIQALAARFQIPAVRMARETNVWLALRNHPAPATNLCLTLVKSGLAARLRQNIRDHLAVADAFCGTAHAGRVTLDVLRESIRALRPGCTLEVGLHPGQAAQPTADREAAKGWHDSIADLRPVELAMLQSSELFDLLVSKNLQLGRIAWLTHPARIAS
jgi:predicted glycoside hydrolase/deacetylase ChbG (UPF0249 family)